MKSSVKRVTSQSQPQPPQPETFQPTKTPFMHLRNETNHYIQTAYTYLLYINPYTAARRFILIPFTASDYYIHHPPCTPFTTTDDFTRHVCDFCLYKFRFIILKSRTWLPLIFDCG